MFRSPVAGRRAAIYTDDVAAMRRAVQASSQKLVALDLRPKPEPVPAKPERKPLAGVLKEHLERQKRHRFFTKLRAAWEAPKWQPIRRAIAALPALGHAERLREHQDRGRQHGR